VKEINGKKGLIATCPKSQGTFGPLRDPSVTTNSTFWGKENWEKIGENFNHPPTNNVE